METFFLAGDFRSVAPTLFQDGDCAITYSCNKIHGFLSFLSLEKKSPGFSLLHISTMASANLNKANLACQQNVFITPY